MSQPNILMIISDQMTPFLTGAYGHPVVQTPALNALAENGIRFDAAYTPFPLCSPARACFIDGKQRRKNWGRMTTVLNSARTSPHLPTTSPGAGYDTVLSGKMHFIGADQLHGFRRRLTTDIYPEDFRWVKPEWIHIKETRGENYQAIMEQRGRYNAANYDGHKLQIDTWHGPLSYDEETHFRSLEYLHAVGTQKNPKPFLLCASYHHPHEPFWPPQSYWDMYENADIEIPTLPDNLGRHIFHDGQMAQRLPRHAQTRPARPGRPLQTPPRLLRTRHIHGRQSWGTARLPKRKWPGRQHHRHLLFGSRRHALRKRNGPKTNLLRLVQPRTLLYPLSRPVQSPAAPSTNPSHSLICCPPYADIAGLEDHYPCDGSNLIPLIEGAETEDREIIVEAHEAVGAPCVMIRKNNFKYNHIHGHEPQLFDLDADPGRME